MLENPWKELQRQREARLANAEESEMMLANDDLSDSLVPQVGDSILERNANINPAPEVAEPDEEGKVLSDSMVPLVGDSLVRDEGEDSMNAE